MLTEDEAKSRAPRLEALTDSDLLKFTGLAALLAIFMDAAVAHAIAVGK